MDHAQADEAHGTHVAAILELRETYWRGFRRGVWLFCIGIVFGAGGAWLAWDGDLADGIVGSLGALFGLAMTAIGAVNVLVPPRNCLMLTVEGFEDRSRWGKRFVPWRAVQNFYLRRLGRSCSMVMWKWAKAHAMAPRGLRSANLFQIAYRDLGLRDGAVLSPTALSNDGLLQMMTEWHERAMRSTNGQQSSSTREPACQISTPA